jgi:hypothetical protein
MVGEDDFVNKSLCLSQYNNAKSARERVENLYHNIYDFNNPRRAYGFRVANHNVMYIPRLRYVVPEVDTLAIM